MSNMIKSNHSQIVWNVLLKTLFYFKKGGVLDEEDKTIIITSPWIKDLENRNFKLSLPIQQVVSNEVGRDLRHLGEVLKVLADSGAKVCVMTAPLDSSWKKDKGAVYKQKEAKLLDSLSRRGVDVRLHDKNHSKSISTPIAVISGSANITDNGFYIFTETMDITNRKEESFHQKRMVVSDVWYEGITRVGPMARA